MTNDEFRTYLKRKHADACRDIKEGKLPPEQLKAAEQARDLLETSMKIMNNCSGAAARRFRRDYQRRLTKIGIDLIMQTINGDASHS